MENVARSIGSIYKYIQLLSIDVVAGVYACTLLVAQCLQVVLAPQIMIVQALAVWCIYTFDHLSDARKLAVTNTAFSERRYFHYQLAPLLWPLLLCAAVIALYLLPQLPYITIKAGFLLSFSVAIYFLFLKLIPSKWHILKEFSIALIYAAGVVVPPLSLTEGSGFYLNALLLFLSVFFMAYGNLILFSLADRQLDINEGQSSVVTELGVSISQRLFWTSCAGAGLTLIFMPGLFPYLIVWCISAMLCVLCVLGICFFKGSCKLLLRPLGDGIFLIPFIFLSC
jgi:hypothetical protein